MSCGWIGLSLVEGSRAMTMDIWYDLIPLSSDVKLTIICITVLVYTASLSPNSLNSYTEKKKKRPRSGRIGLSCHSIRRKWELSCHVALYHRRETGNCTESGPSDCTSCD